VVSKGRYPGYVLRKLREFKLNTDFSQKTGVIPCSDGAGEIVAVGQDVKGWKVGDRVCPNFALDHVYGDVTEEIKNTGLGGQIDGVLREYINVPVHVCILSLSSSHWLPNSYSSP
jgi:NADPH:quinone reductase-like Zn-dependent oxidoreductase